MNPDNDTSIRNAAITAIQDQEQHHGPLKSTDKLVAFPSPLSNLMNHEQEGAMVEFLRKRYEQLDDELGRTASDTTQADPGREWFLGEGGGTNRESYDRVSNTFFGKRLIYEMTYQNKMEWRRGWAGGSTVFKDCNMTLATARRITSQRIARFRKYFFDAEPWFALQPMNPRVEPQNLMPAVPAQQMPAPAAPPVPGQVPVPTGPTTDDLLARKLSKVAEVDLTDSGSKQAFGQAITTASVINEAVIHITRAVDDDHFVEDVRCMVDVDGAAIVAGDGDYIFEDDIWDEAPQAEIMGMDADGITVEPPAEAPPVPVEGEPMLPDNRHMILARDPGTSRVGWLVSTPLGDFQGAEFRTVAVERRTVHYEGARSRVLYHRDILIPLGAEDIQSADCIVHLSKISESDVAQQYAANATADTIKQAVELLRDARSRSIESPYAASAHRPRAALGERVAETRPVASDINVGHFYFRGDPAGRAITSDIYVLMDMDNWIPIYYHFTAACSPTRKRPYRVVRSTEVEGRWFGQGDMERFFNVSMVIDTFLCRAVITQSRAGRIDAFRPDRCEEGKKAVKINYGDTVTPIGDFKLADVFESLYLEDNKSVSLMETLQLLNQAATNESGTATANDAQMAGLENQETATGQSLIRNAGEELTSLPISVLRVGLTLGLDDFIVTTFRFLDKPRTLTLLENNVPKEMKLNKPEVSTLRLNVKILLTPFYRDIERQGQEAALAQAMVYHDLTMTDPWRAKVLKQLFIGIMQNYGVENAQDYVVDRPIEAMPAAPPGPGQPGGDPAGPVPIVPEEPSQPPVAA